jgi:hypothetical protein
MWICIRITDNKAFDASNTSRQQKTSQLLIHNVQAEPADSYPK